MRGGVPPPLKILIFMTKLEKKASQKAKFYQYLSNKVTSCTDVATVLNLPQKSLTWIKKEFELAGALKVVEKNRCPHTGRRVQFITTDPTKFPKPSQLNLFE